MHGKGHPGDSRRFRLDFESAGRVFSMLDDPVMEDPETEGGLPPIPGYVIESCLGSGAGGCVYLARREGQEQKLAIKVLHRPLGDGESSRRVWRELDLLTQTRAPCLPRVIDSFEFEGRLSVVTEYIEGLALDTYCDRHNLDRMRRVELLARVCRAAQSLHERGIIHRDLKPSNVLVTSGGEVFIIDLGIAMLQESDAFSTLTVDGQPMGSPAFMSPEQASSESGRISTRSDVYALGAMAYLVLTGQTPHNMNSTLPSALRRVSEEPARDPKSLDNTMPAGLSAVLQKAVARKPEERYATPSDLAEEFERWRRGDPVKARPLGGWQRGTRWVGRHPIASTTSFGVLILVSSILLTLASVWWLNERPTRLEWRSKGDVARLVTVSGRELRRFPSDNQRYGCVSAAIAERPVGADLAVIVTEYLSDAPDAGLLTVYALDDWSGEPVWTAGRTGVDIAKPAGIVGSPPEGLKNSAKGSFITRWAIVEDIFDAPGDEIIAGHQLNPWSAMAIRVYSTEGEVLYESWHDGLLERPVYDRGGGVLLLSGVNSERRFSAFTESAHDPIVALALPVVEGRTDALVTSESCPPRFAPIWYRVLGPPTIANEMHLQSTGGVSRDRSRAMLMQLGRRGDTSDLRFSISVGTDGRVLDTRIDPEFEASMGFSVDETRLMEPLVENGQLYLRYLP